MRYQQLLSQVVSNYGLLLKALSGVYLRAIQPGSEVTPHSIKTLRAENVKMVQEFARNLSATVAEWVNDLTVNMDGPSREAVESFRARYEPQLTALLMQNVSTTLAAMRGSKGDLAKMLTAGAHGAIGEIIAHNIQNPEFKALDESGRKWDSEKLFKFIMRNWLYSTEIRADIEDILADRIDLAMIRYDDPEHKNNGLVFSIEGKTEGYPTLADIQASIFHFNATAEVVRVSA